MGGAHLRQRRDRAPIQEDVAGVEPDLADREPDPDGEGSGRRTALPVGRLLHGRVDVVGERHRHAVHARDGVEERPERVLEVKYDHMEGRRFRHTAQFKRWRPDRDPESCGYDQLEQPARYDVESVLRGEVRPA